ncbi:MAG: DUF1800 domain-containing protein [Planctomycetota bacterium]|jgi:uncharacterized protein (DUF1800 family)
MILATLLSLLPLGPGDPGPTSTDDLVFDARAAEHLLSRAGFGATTDEVEAAVEAGLDATIERLFAGSGRARDPFYAERLSPYNVTTEMRRGEIERRTGMSYRRLDAEERRDARREFVREQRRVDTTQLDQYTEWWISSMIEGYDPLRDRMALFWHGYFTSSQEDVRDSYEMILQAELLREGAFGDFGELLRGVAKSPAMLEYLDNDDNKKGEPNENFARELLELFTLGEGHYSETDILEVARSFTGWTDRKGEFSFRRSRHDREEKTVLGETGEFDGDDVLDILIAHERTPVHVAERLLRYLEGRAPTPERAAHYGAILRENDLVLAPMLDALFRDPEFYAEGVVGERIASPIDLLVGLSRRLRVDPPVEAVAQGARLLGERLFHPPNVKGWEGEESWITTATFMQRGNLAGVLLGEVEIEDLLDEEDAEPGSMMAAIQARMMGEEPEVAAPRSQALRGLGRAQRIGWEPRYNLSARLERADARTDEAAIDFLVDDLLAIEVERGTREELIILLESKRLESAIDEGEWRAAGSDGERSLRLVAHVICSLPEAQLH